MKRQFKIYIVYGNWPCLTRQDWSTCVGEFMPFSVTLCKNWVLKKVKLIPEWLLICARVHLCKQRCIWSIYHGLCECVSGFKLMLQRVYFTHKVWKCDWSSTLNGWYFVRWCFSANGVSLVKISCFVRVCLLLQEKAMKVLLCRLIKCCWSFCHLK